MVRTLESPTGRSCRQCQAVYLEASDFKEKNNLRGAPHHPFSVDIAPSNFFLFRCIKGKLQETEFTEKDDLLAEIREISNGRSGKVLKAVLIAWEKRMQTCTDARGEYAESLVIHAMTHVQQPSRRVDANFKRNTLDVPQMGKVFMIESSDRRDSGFRGAVVGLIRHFYLAPY
jgi:hypothetical protein